MSVNYLKVIVASAVFTVSSAIAFAQAPTAQGAPASPGASGGTKPSAQENAAAAKADAAKSLHDIRKETLLYGIDSQIQDLLATLQTDKDNTLNPEVEQVFKETINPDVQKAALDLLDTVKDWAIAPEVEKILTNRLQSGDTGDDTVVISAIRYLTDAKDASALPLMTKLVDDQSRSIAFEAIASIGKLGGDSQAQMLLANLKDPNFAQVLKPQIVLALGEIKSLAAVPELTSILQNQDQDPTMRRYACDALGKIGDPSSIKAITRAFSDKDTYLRSYAVSALSHFSGPQVDTMLTQALKDSFWRVRVNAAESLGKKKVASAVPILEYKSRYDPELVVQKAALAALGTINNSESIDFLRKVFSNSLVNPALRTVALDSLVSNDLPGSLSEIEKYIHSEWDKPTNPLLDYTCKQLSQAKDPKLEPLFERFLSSPSLNIQIYGLRGIRQNNFKDLLKKVQEFDKPTVNTSVRAAAEQAIQTLK
ncbi:MAG TPA: HEAT repeat domain-containing protein [Spirochaetia bacterium]|nr:HEAT repeat domain-containing protein [Spirochaetia bacterium]